MTLIDELSGLDFGDAANWTRRVKLLLAGLACIGVVAAGYYLIIKEKTELLEQAQRKEPILKNTFLEKKALAINLDAYKEQMVKAEETFEILKGQLPNESEIPDLLIDMTQVGLSRGLQFEQIKPGNTINKDFYAEKSVNIRANGEFHQIANFISDVAALPRIINIENFNMTRNADSTTNLSLQAVTKTYHYLEDSPDEE